MKPISCLAIVLTLMAGQVSLFSYGQIQADIQAPKIVPPSPDAAALGKYGEIPVDKSTGVPQIAVPLYEIKTPRFTVPINLSYHASGIKLDEVASWVGAGWVLNAGGAIIRTCVGLTDFVGNGFINQTVKKASQIQWPTDYLYISNVVTRMLDTESDNYSYNFNGYSGSFVFGDNKQPLLTSYKPIKISWNNSLLNFTVTDEQGNKYLFHTPEGGSTSLGAQMSGISTWYLTKMISADLTDTIDFNYVTDVAQTEDWSYNFSQKLWDFGQGNGNNQMTAVEPTVTTRVFYTVRISSIVYKGGKVEFTGQSDRLDEGKRRLDEVTVYNADPATGTYKKLKSYKLLQDYFYSSHTIPANYPYSVSTQQRYRLKLTGLRENDATNTIVREHLFEYNNTMLPWVRSFAQDRYGFFNGQMLNLSLLELQNVVMYTYGNPSIVTIGTDGVVQRGANRTISPGDMQAGVLTKITYPTKGYTTFTYENNKYWAPETAPATFQAAAVGINQESQTTNYTPTSEMLGSGGNMFRIMLRKGDAVSGTPLPQVKIVRVSDGNIMYSLTANPSAAIDQYVLVNNLSNVAYQLVATAQGGTSPTSSNLPFALINTTCQVHTGSPVVNAGGLRIKSINNFDSDNTAAGTQTFYYGTNLDNESGGGVLMSPFNWTNHYMHGYRNIIDADPGSPVACLIVQGQIETYSNNSYYPMGSLNGSPVGYPKVKIYHGDSLNNIGRSIYLYSIFPDVPTPIFGDQINTVKQVPVRWKNGEPTYEAHYRNNGNNTYSLVSDVTNTYDIVSRTGGTGTVVGYVSDPLNFQFSSPNLQGNSVYTVSPIDCGDIFSNQILWVQSYLYWYDYPITAGHRVLSQTVAKNYAPDGVANLGTTTNYYYDNQNHILPTRIETFTSKGETRLKQIRYPQDMVNASLDPTGIYNSMVTANMVSSAIEETNSINAVQLLKTTNNYALFNTTMIKPSSVDVKNTTNPVETRLQYHSYDSKGNPVAVSKDAGVKTNYIWGYKGLYPVAMVTNANSNSIFYESFEEFNGNSMTDDCKTGHYSRTGSFSKSLTGLDNGAHILKYWQKSGVTWSQVTTPVTVAGNSYTINLSGQVDDVCFYPAGAQMTTYRYDPHVGLTSLTDARGVISYYQYDAFCRLVLIKDKDNNILKKFCYNYADQPENCNIPGFTNVVKSGNFTRNNCSSGTGSTVTYTVPASTYTSYVSQADADQQAQTDVNNNGQAYANANGTCNTTCSFSPLSGFTLPVSSIGAVNNTVSFNIKFVPSSNMLQGTEYMIANVSSSCRPQTNRTMTLFTLGRSFFVTFYAATGNMGVRIISGGNINATTEVTLTNTYDKSL